MRESKGAVRLINRYSEALKRKVSEEVSSGLLTTREAMNLYGIKHRRTVDDWVYKYSDSRPRAQVVRIMMKSEKERIEELEKALADSEVKRMVYASQLESYEEHAPDLKKRLSTKELREFEKNEARIQKFR